MLILHTATSSSTGNEINLFKPSYKTVKEGYQQILILVPRGMERLLSWGNSHFFPALLYIDNRQHHPHRVI